MKRFAKKLLAALLTVAIAVSGLVVSASADGVFDKAKELKELDKISISDFQQNRSVYYKIDIPREGTLTIKCTQNYCTTFAILSPDDELLYSTKSSAKTFTVEDMAKGTYYLQIYDSYGLSYAYVNDLYYTFVPNEKPVISLGVTLQKGNKIQLDALTENYDGKVTWKSTKKSIATVSSKGLFTAKKAGTTYIRAQMDNGDYVEIKVVDKKK